MTGFFSAIPDIGACDATCRNALEVRTIFLYRSVRFTDATSSGSGKIMYGERDRNRVIWRSGNRLWTSRDTSNEKPMPLIFSASVLSFVCCRTTAKSVSPGSSVLRVVIVKALIFWRYRCVPRRWNEQSLCQNTSLLMYAFIILFPTCAIIYAPMFLSITQILWSNNFSALLIKFTHYPIRRKSRSVYGKR